MNNPLYIATIRGAGIGLFVGALLFTITDRPVSFLAIPAGLLLGLISGLVGRRRSPAGADEQGTPTWEYSEAPLTSRLLVHPILPVRFLSLFTLAAVLFVLAWYAGYYWLPEGSLAGHSGSPDVIHERAPSVVSDWLRMATWNLVPMATAVAANAFMRVRGIPMGYLAILVPTVSYGLTLGTNSFTFPMPERMAPSLKVLQRAGPYEFAAMILVITATYALSRFELNGFGQTEWKRNPDSRNLTTGEWVAVALGVALLFAAAWREAIMIHTL